MPAVRHTSSVMCQQMERIAQKVNSSQARADGPRQWAITVLTLITAVIHIWLGLSFLDAGGLIFVLNGVGFLGLLVLFSLNLHSLVRYRRWLRWLLIAYTAITVIAWALIGNRTLLAYSTKAVEVALIALLWLDDQRR